MVDEYGGDTLSAKSTRTSTRPLTLGALERFFNSSWSIFDVLEANFSDTGYNLEQMLRYVVGITVLYVLVLWGEALRLHGLLTGTLKAIQQYGQAMRAPARNEPKDPRVRLEAARLLIAALQSPDEKIRTTSHHNLVRLVGQDLGHDPAAWLSWLQREERGS